MIRMILTAATLLAATATASFAADLPATSAAPVLEEPPVIPVFSWTGFEAGVHAGYEIGRDTSTVRTAVVGGTTGFSPNGVIGGLHAGYNRAFPGLVGAALVAGIEGDVDGADYQRTSAPFAGALGGSNTSVQSDIKGSIRGRLGVGVNRVLYYATGGATFASFDTRFNGAGTNSSASATADRVQAGYTVGGGVEYAFMNTMTVRAEYRYSDYGTFTDTLGGTSPALNPTIAHRETDNRLQAGLSYKFDSIAP